MSFITDEERRRIEAAIQEAERRTSGELVTVIAKASDDYYYIPTLWAAILALGVPIALHLAAVIQGIDQLLIGQMGGFIVLGLIFRWPALKMWLVPKSVKRERAAALAVGQFVEQGLHRTEAGTGVLIFVSVAERHVEILADFGINEKVPPDTWQVAVDKFTAEVKAGRVANGFLEAIDDCGRVLAEHFPAGTENKNELSNRLIEI